MTVGRRRRTAEVASIEVDDEVVLWHEGVLHRLNPMAAVVWAVLAEPVTDDDVVGTVAASFGQDVDTARPGVLALLGQLAQTGVIERVP